MVKIKYSNATPEHPGYASYMYWKKNKDTIKQRIEQTFELDYKLP